MHVTNRSPLSRFMWTLVVALAGCKAGTDESGEGSSGGESGAESTGATGGETGGTGVTSDTGAPVDPQPECTDKSGEPGVLLWERTGQVYDETFSDSVLTTTVALDVVHAGGRAGKLFVEAVDAQGEPRWSAEHAGEGARDTWPLDAAADAAGVVHVLAYEWVDEPGLDGRLVVLRYSPDGVFEWRWERLNPPTENSSGYMPRGGITVTGEEIHVVEANTGHSAVLLRVDTGGILLGEVSLETPPYLGTFDTHLDFAPDGALVLADMGWVGRFMRDGSPVWSDDLGERRPDVVVAGHDGDTFLGSYVIDPQDDDHTLRHYRADGTVDWTTALPSVFVRAGVRGGTGCDTALLLGGSVPDETHTSESLWVVGFSGEGTPLWELAPMFDEPDARGAVLNVAVTHDGDGVVLGYYSTGTPGMIESFPWLARVSSD